MKSEARILVVDDDASIRFFLEETLSRDGHSVVAVDSGAAALNEMARQEFDLALIDLKLKGTDGLEVLGELRRRSPATVTIMLTAHASLDTAVEALRQGAHDYLFKPCRTVELRESVRTALLKRQRELWQRDVLAELERRLADVPMGAAHPPDQARPAAPSPAAGTDSGPELARFLERGDLIVDFMRHVITLKGQLLELSPTEFDLLAYLASAAPRVVPQQELVREVRGYDVNPREASELLRYHIYRLRQKMNAATGRDPIRTVRGVGYSLSE